MMDFLIENYLVNSLNLSSNKMKLLLNHPTESRFKALFEYNRQKKKKSIDFFYIPKTIKTRKNLRVAFVNVLNFKQIVPIYMGLLYKMKFIYSSPKIQMEICYSKVQGKELLMKRFFPNEMINLNHIKNC